MIGWQAFWVSTKLALLSSLLLLLVGIPPALWLAYGRSRWKPVFEAFFLLPFVLPPAVLGPYLLLMLAPLRMAFTFEGILLGSVILNLPIAIQCFAEGFRGVRRDWRDASRSFGAGAYRTFLFVILPLSWPGLLTGFMLSFAHAFGEFGVAMMLGGNLRGETRTVAIAIYDSVQGLDMETAQWTATAQILFCLLLLTLLSLIRQKSRTLEA